MSNTFRLMLVPVCATLLACGDVSAPDFAEIYVLRSVADDPLPSVYRDGDFATLYVVADTLFLEADGSGLEVQYLELVDKASGSHNGYVNEIDLDYVVVDGRIEISYVCADMGSCIAPPHLAGPVTITGIVCDVSLGRVPLNFERLDTTTR